MTGNLVITIGRECGSGGRLIGNRLAERLNIKCYDKELLTLAAKKSGLCEEIFESHDEKPTSSFLYSLVMDSYSMGYSTSSFIDMPLNHKVFLAQFDTIKHLADTESCVIVGRCADYALAENPDGSRLKMRHKRHLQVHRDVRQRMRRSSTFLSCMIRHQKRQRISLLRQIRSVPTITIIIQVRSGAMLAAMMYV